MKTVEQLQELSKNPFYILNAEEAKLLESLDSEEDKKKLPLKNATVKETGKLNKHHGDPVGE